MLKSSWITVFQKIRENKMMRDRLTHKFSLIQYEDQIKCNACGTVVGIEYDDYAAVDVILSQCQRDPAYVRMQNQRHASRKIKWLSAPNLQGFMA